MKGSKLFVPCLQILMGVRAFTVLFDGIGSVRLWWAVVLITLFEALTIACVAYGVAGLTNEVVNVTRRKEEADK